MQSPLLASSTYDDGCTPCYRGSIKSLPKVNVFSCLLGALVSRGKLNHEGKGTPKYEAINKKTRFGAA